MHMADALLSPAVGVGFYVISGAALALASGKLKRQLAQHSELVPLMGVLGAFVFAAQMINFSIPGTGSSGHLSGALLLAILLGPWAGVLVIASVLLVQALFLPMAACWLTVPMCSTWASLAALPFIRWSSGHWRVITAGASG